MPKENRIWIAGEPFAIDWPTVTFAEDRRFDANAPGEVKCFRTRRIAKRSLREAQAAIQQFVVHLDGCADSATCFQVLNTERRLSCHFLIDNDGTIYQTLDLIDCAFHACEMNETSIGVELANRGNAKKEPQYYEHQGLPLRDVRACTVNGETFLAYDFTPQQYAAMEVLGRRLAKLLPRISLDYPQSSPGVQAWDTLPSPTEYSGYLGHYHVTPAKWDPGPFDFKRFIGRLSGRRSFPIGLHGQTEIPDAPPEKLWDDYYTNNEYDGERAGGYFPVGPLELSQLWHGGIHLHAAAGANVVAPLAGEVIAARNGPLDAHVGSTSFVLLRHAPRIGIERPIFYTLLYHLAEERGLPWMAGDDWKNTDPGHTVVFKTPHRLQPGELVGHVGLAGPNRSPQIHWEIFATDHDAIDRLDKGGFWVDYSGAGDQRICNNKDVLDRLEQGKHDGKLTHEELEAAYQGDPADHLWTRRTRAYHYSEWSDQPSWLSALSNAPELHAKGEAGLREARAIYDEQIVPGLWLTDAVGQALDLPTRAPVYTYHPVSFMRFLHGLLSAPNAGGARKPTATDVENASKGGLTDYDDVAGKYARAANEVREPRAKDLALPDMVEGYPD